MKGVKNIITMSGDIGGGKSSAATALQEMTKYNVIGTGKIQRAIAERRGLTTLELNKVSQTDKSIDKEIDSYVIEIGKTKDNLIIDSRLAWHFIPPAFKVFLSVDPLVGAERVFSALRSDENNQTIDATLKNNLQRQEIEDSRFRQLYNVNFRKYSNYDLVIDTSYTKPEVIAQKIYDCFEKRLNNIKCPILWTDPRKLLPTQNIKDCVGSEYENIVNSIADNGFQEAQPLDVFVCRGYIYIWDGHKRTIAARKAGVKLLPAKILADDPADELIKGRSTGQVANYVSLTVLHDWEDALEFKFKTYPDKESGRAL